MATRRGGQPTSMRSLPIQNQGARSFAESCRDLAGTHRVQGGGARGGRWSPRIDAVSQKLGNGTLASCFRSPLHVGNTKRPTFCGCPVPSRQRNFGSGTPASLAEESDSQNASLGIARSWASRLAFDAGAPWEEKATGPPSVPAGPRARSSPPALPHAPVPPRPWARRRAFLCG